MTAPEIVVSSVPTAPVRIALGRRILRRPLAVIALAYLTIVAAVAVVGPLIVPLDPHYKDIRAILLPPGGVHVLGTDGSGHDVWSRLLASTQTSFAAALLALAVAFVIGVTGGLIAGYYQGWFASVASWVTELNMALPGIVLLLAVRTALGPSIWIAMIVFGILLSPSFYRLVYASVSAVREELYVDAARVSGLSDGRIIARHVLSVVRAPIIIQAAIIGGIAVAIQSGLEFLGLGEPTSPTWGSMLSDAFRYIYQAPLLMVWPSALLALTCIALALLANVMRDELERTTRARRRRRAAVRTVVETPTGTVSAVTTSLRTVTRPSPRRKSQPVVSTDLAAAQETVETIVHPQAQSDVPSILTVERLRVGYDQPDGSHVEVVRGVSFDVRKGEVHGLIGESGSGKTQTAFSVLGLLPKGGLVTGGTITFDGVQLEGASERVYADVRGKRIGYIPQEPMSNLDPSFTVGQQLTEPLRRHLGLSKKDARARSLALLDRVGIPEPERVYDSYPHEISGGMAQRVLIAGAVSLDPELIIADEPTTALDVTVQAEILDLLRDLQTERGMAMLLVTHNFGVVADLCDRVTVMQSGFFVEQGPVRAIFNSPGHPYTKALLGAILDDGPARPPLVTDSGASK